MARITEGKLACVHCRAELASDTLEAHGVGIRAERCAQAARRRELHAQGYHFLNVRRGDPIGRSLIAAVNALNLTTLIVDGPPDYTANRRLHGYLWGPPWVGALIAYAAARKNPGASTNVLHIYRQASFAKRELVPILKLAVEDPAWTKTLPEMFEVGGVAGLGPVMQMMEDYVREHAEKPKRGRGRPPKTDPMTDPAASE